MLFFSFLIKKSFSFPSAVLYSAEPNHSLGSAGGLAICPINQRQTMHLIFSLWRIDAARVYHLRGAYLTQVTLPVTLVKSPVYLGIKRVCHL